MVKSYKYFIEDILESINKIELYIKDITYEEFISTSMLVDAVIRNIEIIGEAARYIPEDVRERHSEIPWRRMIGLRNIMIHQYFGVDFSIIWNVAKVNLPDIKPLLKQILHGFD